MSAKNNKYFILTKIKEMFYFVYSYYFSKLREEHLMPSFRINVDFKNMFLAPTRVFNPAEPRIT